MTKWLTIVLALVGTAVAAYTVATNGKDKAPSPPPATPPSVNPFVRGIACAGSVEAATRNIALGSPEGALVAEVFVEVGQKVSKGDALFSLDTRLLQAELVRTEATLKVARAEIEALEAQPRPEELPPLLAAWESAKVAEADARDMLTDMQNADKRSAMSRSEMARRRFAVDQAAAQTARAKAQYDLAAAGAWRPLLAVARTRVAAGEADISAIRLRIERLTVRSPIDGSVLKRNVEPGQFAGAAMMGGPNGVGTPSQAAMVVGDLSRLRVRARVDEEDAPLLREGAKAVARVRGVAPEALELRMVRVEPLAQSKVDLTGSTVERVDTRVIEVVFDVIGVPANPLYPGQAVDVFIEVAPAVGVR